jgi:hypothetical protein
MQAGDYAGIHALSSINAMHMYAGMYCVACITNAECNKGACALAWSIFILLLQTAKRHAVSTLWTVCRHLEYVLALPPEQQPLLLPAAPVLSCMCIGIHMLAVPAMSAVCSNSGAPRTCMLLAYIIHSCWVCSPTLSI